MDRKEQHKSSTSENDQEMGQNKSRLKKDVNNDSVNYLSLFQLNPLLMHAATGVNPAQSFQPSLKGNDNINVKMEETFMDELNDDRINMSSDNSALLESVLEQKQLNDTFDMVNLIELSIQGGFENASNGNLDETPQAFINNLTDENLTQFKIQVPNLLPKMHFVCEMGSRTLFKTFDWLRDMQILQSFETETQSQMLMLNWAELMVLGLAQVISTSQQAAQLKSMIVSSLVNYVKSLILCSANEANQVKPGAKGEQKPASGQKLKRMLINIMMINKFIDSIMDLDLDCLEFAHLRVLCLFNPNKFIYSSDPKLRNLHQKVASSLHDYLQSRSKQDSKRLISIFQTMSVLPSFDSKIIEKIFFNILVDFIKIENVIPYIMNLNAETGEHKIEVKKEKELDVNDENNSHSMNSDDQRYYNYSGDEK